MRTTTTNTPGMLEDHILYRADEFMKRMGWGRKAFDAARRRGLEVLPCSKRLYVQGKKGREFVERDAAARLTATQAQS
jgi:hypothetical protein